MIPYVKGGSWGFPILVPQNSFKGSTVGLYGFGNIPRLIAKKLSGFEVKLISADPFVKQTDAAPYGVTMVSFDELLEQSDYICVQAPLLESTRGAFNAAAFSKMKRTAFIINTARGPLINQDDLYTALTTGMIKGAALDVLEHEPPLEEDRKIVALPNVVCTGHSGFYSVESFANQEKLTVDNLVRVLNGQLPNNIVNKEILDRIDWGK